VRRKIMDFWIGLSVGMHLGRVLADYLERFGKAYGLLDSATVEQAEEKIQRRRELGAIVEKLVD
jgi:hypothetical protein